MKKCSQVVKSQTSRAAQNVSWESHGGHALVPWFEFFVIRSSKDDRISEHIQQRALPYCKRDCIRRCLDVNQ